MFVYDVLQTHWHRMIMLTFYISYISFVHLTTARIVQMQSMSMDHVVECKYKYDVICPGNVWYKTVTTAIKGHKKSTMTYFGHIWPLILGIWGSWEFENLRILGSLWDPSSAGFSENMTNVPVIVSSPLLLSNSWIPTTTGGHVMSHDTRDV